MLTLPTAPCTPIVSGGGRRWGGAMAHRMRKRWLCGLGAALAVLAGGTQPCGAERNTGVVHIAPRSIHVQVLVDTDNGNDKLVSLTGHANCSAQLVPPFPPAMQDGAPVTIPVTIADADDAGRLVPLKTDNNGNLVPLATITLPASGSSVGFVVAGAVRSRIVGDARLQVRYGSKKIGGPWPATVYSVTDASMVLAPENGYTKSYIYDYDQGMPTAVNYCVWPPLWAVQMTANATLCPANVAGPRLNHEHLAVLQNVLASHDAVVYRSYSITWGPLPDKGFHWTFYTEWQRVNNCPLCPDSARPAVYPTVYDSKPLTAGQDQTYDGPSQPTAYYWHQKTLYGGLPRHVVAVVEYSDPGFEYNEHFRDWTVTYNDKDIHGTLSKWAEADWWLNVKSLTANMHITKSDSVPPTDTAKVGENNSRVANDYNEQVWGPAGHLVTKSKP